MPVNYIIRASVIDIQIDRPTETDAFLVDSNVWFWMTYSSASSGAMHYQITQYPNYVDQALATGARICHSGLSMAELANIIERTEREIYSGCVQAVCTKEYRHSVSAEHSRVASEVEAIWAQVKALADQLDVPIDDPTTDSALTRFQTQLVDGYDLFVLETMAKHNILQVITDDGDFTSVPGIQVFTANRNVLHAARAQRKLVAR